MKPEIKKKESPKPVFKKVSQFGNKFSFKNNQTKFNPGTFKTQHKG